ncbi:MAG: HDIG domain-containing protein [Candidatus Omnitrophica bacterium]|nr:HDIG domain-containing protein [Candidatus Omnitrophota bacterium]
MVKPVIQSKFSFITGVLLIFLLSSLLGINFILPLFLLSIFIYFKFYLRELKESKKLLYPLFLFVLLFAVGYFFGYKRVSLIYLPFSAIPMLATLLFNELEIAFLLSVSLFVSIGFILNNYSQALLFLIGGIFSSIFVFGARRRMAIIKAGFFTGLIQALSLFFINNFKVNDAYGYLLITANGIFCGLVVLAILPLFEIMFGTVTNISLLELMDTPLLNRLKSEAPGTYHHSLVVGNLAESASLAIGANGLLARIGSYYHDIGKLEKPLYFNENQDPSDNKHKTLSPTMSKMIIMNHVKEGLELARKYKLNPRIIDFIIQHHGTSLVHYFYYRALENLEEDQDIKEEGFRYPGPKPNTKETAIVLLADSVEAASRSLKEPTVQNIEEMVHKIINNKFIDGQFDDCDLTLRDLEKIAQTFIRILTSIYHSRVTYPETSVSSK